MIFHHFSDELNDFSPTPKLCELRSLAQICSGAIRCSFNTRFRTRFRRFPVQIAGEVPEGSGADTRVPRGSGEDEWWGSGRLRADTFKGSRRFQCRDFARFRRVGADTWWSFGSFRRRCLVRFPVQIPWEVPGGSGADALWSSKGFRCFSLHKHLILQQQNLVLCGSGEASGEFWRTVHIRFLQVWRAMQIVFWQVPVQRPKVPEGTGVWHWKKCWNYHAVGDSTWVYL